MSLLSRQDLLGLLDEVAAALDARGVRGHVFVVGGAAMALAWDSRRTTRDLDAVFVPADVVRAVAVVVARRHGLPDDWLNDGVKGFLPGDDPDATTLMDTPGLAVTIGSPRYLFATKVMASRVERDAHDLVALYRLSGYESVDEALDDAARRYGRRPLPARADFLLREVLDDPRDEGSDDAT